MESWSRRTLAIARKSTATTFCLQGFSIEQVVHDYGDVCQSITDLAVELGAPISTEDFRTLNRCLDNAIAGAVTEFTCEQGITRDKRIRRTQHVARRCDIRPRVLY